MRCWLLVLAAVAACDPSSARLDATSPDTASPDAARVDAGGPDAAIDGPVDARTDATIDAPADATFKDAPLAIDDASIDASPDAAIDARPDAAIDAPQDAAIDAVPDAAPDAAVPAITFDFAPPHAEIHPARMNSVMLFGISNRTTQPLDVTASVSATITASVSPTPCLHLLPNQNCTFVVTVEPELGAFSGTVTVTGNGLTAQADFDGIGEAFVDGEPAITSRGTITRDVTGNGCDGNCYLDGTVVTLTAHPGSGAVFTGWDDPTCGTSPTCSVTAGADPQTRFASFDLAPPVAFEVDFIGDHPGEVAIDDNESIQHCTSSCVVSVRGNTDLFVQAATPARFDGFGAPCGAATTCLVPAGTATLAVDFEGERNEIDLELDGDVFSVDYDPSGDLLVGTDKRVEVLTPSLAVAWSRTDLAGVARFAPDGNVFVMTSTALFKLDANGNEVWHVAGGQSPLLHGPRMFAPMHDGGVAVNNFTTFSNFSVDIRAADGSLAATFTPLNTPDTAIAVDSADNIYIPVIDAERDDLVIVAPDGTETGVLARADLNNCAMVIDSTDDIVFSGTGHGHADLQRFATDGTSSLDAFVDILSSRGAPSAVAVDEVGDIAWLVANRGDESVWGFDLSERSPIGTIEWSISRPPTDFIIGPGHVLVDAASSIDHVAVGGEFDGGEFFTSTGIVVIFDR